MSGGNRRGVAKTENYYYYYFLRTAYAVVENVLKVKRLLKLTMKKKRVSRVIFNTETEICLMVATHIRWQLLQCILKRVARDRSATNFYNKMILLLLYSSVKRIKKTRLHTHIYIFINYMTLKEQKKNGISYIFLFRLDVLIWFLSLL